MDKADRQSQEVHSTNLINAAIEAFESGEELTHAQIRILQVLLSRGLECLYDMVRDGRRETEHHDLRWCEKHNPDMLPRAVKDNAYWGIMVIRNVLSIRRRVENYTEALKSKRLAVSVLEELHIVHDELERAETDAIVSFVRGNHRHAIRLAQAGLASVYRISGARLRRLAMRIAARLQVQHRLEGEGDELRELTEFLGHPPTPTQIVAWRIFRDESEDGIIDEVRRTRHVEEFNGQLPPHTKPVNRSSVVSQVSKWRKQRAEGDNGKAST